VFPDGDAKVPGNLYHFEDHWHVPFPIERVWEVISKPEEYPTWWHGVYLSAKPLEGKNTPGQKAVAVVAKGWLPYKLHFVIETTALQKPHVIEFKTSGDFVTDSSRWILGIQGEGTGVTLQWNPRVEKKVVRFLSPLLKPLFRWNHNWTMKRGERQIAEYLAQRRADRPEGD
jgi:uncharacterized protein YndB with AHSA1/START domain